MRTRVKICGICAIEDALVAHEAGADYVGLVLTESPRRVGVDTARRIQAALPPGISPVGVFTGEPPDIVLPLVRDLRLGIVQVSSWIDREPVPGLDVWHVLRESPIPDPASLPMVPLRTYVLDASDPSKRGGTGRLSDHEWAALAVRCGLRLVVAGGLDAERVGAVVTEIRPYGVDASSRLEISPGRKDPEKVRAFVERVRSLDRARPQRS